MFWIVVAIASAILFHKIGDTEFDGRGWLFAGISIAISVGCNLLLQWGMLGVALAQVGFFAIVTVYNMYLGKGPRM